MQVPNRRRANTTTNPAPACPSPRSAPSRRSGASKPHYCCSHPTQCTTLSTLTGYRGSCRSHRQPEQLVDQLTEVGSDTTPGATTGAPAKGAAKPKVLLDQTGQGAPTTPKQFNAPQQWSLNYKFDCSVFGTTGNFIVTVTGVDGLPVAVPVNAVAASGNPSTQVYNSGTLHLEINSECSWHVTILG